MLYGYRELKILILGLYYNRPLLVRNALRSLRKATERHRNWHLAFGDDGSEYPGRPIVEEELQDCLEKVSFHNTGRSIEDKIYQGISIGKLANDVLAHTDADVVITLCDDDELHPDYFWNLNRYFLKNPHVMYCYSNIILFNPFKERPGEVALGPYNEHSGPIDCYGKVDASQVAYRVECIRNFNIWYRDTTKSGSSINQEHPWRYNLDGELFKEFSRKIGPAHYTGFVSQFKGMHEYQLVYKKEHVFRSREDILRFHGEVLDLAGKTF